MSVTITINAVAANLDDAPIGVAAALSELGAFASASSVQWELTTPPDSSAALTTVGAIMAAPFDNDFTPDVPGNYRVRLIVTLTSGTVEEDTKLARVLMPWGVDADETLPAPLEEREEDANIGWADEANLMRRSAHARYSGAEWLTVLNDTGADIPAGTVVQVNDVLDWPSQTGAGTGSAVPGATVDYIRTIVPATTAAENLALVVTAITDGAKGRVLRRGIVVYDTTAFGVPVNSFVGYAGVGALLVPYHTWAADGACGKILVAGTPSSAPPGVLWFDPGTAERLWQPPLLEVTLSDNEAAPVTVGSRLQWVVAVTTSAMVRYEITRGATPDTEVGHMTVSTEGVGSVSVASHVGAVDPGVVFSVAVGAGVAALKYTTTNTGFDATLKFRLLEEFRA